MIITIDGPAGTGKSTVATHLAKKLDFVHLDTGALYRTVTYGALAKNIAINDQAAIEAFAEEYPVFVTSHSDHTMQYMIASIDATPHIRSSAVTHAVSQVATYPKVRYILTQVQHSLAKGLNVVSEGRDIGTNVFPQAEVKIYLTASSYIRAQRRFTEMKEKGLLFGGVDVAAIEQEINQRDYIDSTRKEHPLTIPLKAHIVDTSHMSIMDVVHTIMSYVAARRQQL